MLKIATAKEMQQIDRSTIEKFGIAGAVLMERAGLGAAARINDMFPVQKVFVLCGGGNNGGDGLVIARVLHNQGRDVEVFLTASPGSLKGEALLNYKAAKKFGVKIYPINKFLALSQPSVKDTVIVDALLGTGLSSEVKAPFSDIIRKVNKMSVPVVSIDLPSGISSDTGQIMGCAVKASCTVTFGLAKRGHFLYPGTEHTGQLFIEEIGFPKTLLESEKIMCNLLQKEDAVSLLPSRPKYSYKGTYGHVLIVAGSRGKTGAALMAAKACLRTGAGLVTIGIADSLVNTFQARVTEEMLLPLPDKGDGTLSLDAADDIINFITKQGNVLAIGPGLSVDKGLSSLVCRLIRESSVPMVIDADGLNAIADNPEVLRKGRAPIILTPHPGEMARLLKGSGVGPKVVTGFSMRDEIEKDRINIAIAFAKKTNTCVVLKGVPTVTAAPNGRAFINTTGNPGMATAGTGDVLTGMISAFLAQGLSPENAAILGVYLHGYAGDIVAEKTGQRSLIASDIIKAIPKGIKLLNKNNADIAQSDN